MARLPYVNFHDMNLDWVLKVIKKAFTPDNPPPYPVKSVNGMTENVTVTGDVVPLAPNNPKMVTEAIREKQDAPASPGTPGQVLSLDQNQTPVWSNPDPGVTDYDNLQNRPKINSITLTGEQSGVDLGLLDAPAVAGAAGEVLQSNGDNTQSWVNLNNKFAPIIRDTASGDIASFPDGIADMPMNVIANIVPVQPGSGDPSPSNPRPISGSAGMTISRTGKNLFDKDADISANNYYLNDSGVQITSTNYKTTDYIKIKPSTYYYWAINGVPADTTAASHNAPRVAYYDENKNYISSGNVLGTSGSATQSPVNAVYARLPVYVNNPMTVRSAMFTEGATIPSAYEPYNGTTYPVAWGDVSGTVYGGYYNNRTGKLTVTYSIMNLGDLTWDIINHQTLGTYFYAPISGVKKVDGAYSVVTYPAISNKYKAVPRSLSTFIDETFCFDGSNTEVTQIQIKDSAYSTASDFQTAMSDVQLVYELATPIEYTLYPVSMDSFYADNNVFSDAGPISVDYYADTKLFILKVV